MNFNSINVIEFGCRTINYWQLSPIIGVVKDATPNLTVKRSDVVRAVIVRTKHSITRKDGTRLRFDDNASVIISKENNPRGTRVFGSIARELKDKGFTKIVSLAPEVL